jgi:hypothetical protein
VVELKIPPLPPSLKATPPEGAEAVPGLASVTVIVKVIGEKSPMTSDALLGNTAVVVALVIERDEVAELPE